METEPIHILSLGAGVQSSTLALMAAHGKVPHLPKLSAAIFADTQDEPESVYSWLNYLDKAIQQAPNPFPVYRVTAGKLSEKATQITVTKDGRKATRSNIPTFTVDSDGTPGRAMIRGCTVDFKVAPVLKKARELGNVPRKAREGNRVHVVQWIGISLDEIYRMKPSRDWWAENVWPLVDLKMNRHDCKRWMEANGFPEPPRSSCVFCPFHNDHEWRRLKMQESVEFQKAVDFERAIQKAKAESDNFRSVPFLHKSLKPLDEVDFSSDEDHGQLNLFNQECLGMCGV